MTIRDIQLLVDAAENWAKSDEGQKAIKETQQRVEETTAFLSAERVVDRQMLLMPHCL